MRGQARRSEIARKSHARPRHGESHESHGQADRFQRVSATSGAVPRPAASACSDFGEIFTHPPEEHLRKQGARCMDCGVPFCQSDIAAARSTTSFRSGTTWSISGRWRDALDRLHKTNNFPEFTGRVCPAPCEGSCVLGITEPPVTIKNIENAIIDRGFAEGWVVAAAAAERAPARRSRSSAPARRAWPPPRSSTRPATAVTVFERADRIGGLLMYGIPNMKLDKREVVQRRVELLAAEGVKFVTNCRGRQELSEPKKLRSEFDAIVLCDRRDASRATCRSPGREPEGHPLRDGVPAPPTPRACSTAASRTASYISAKGKDVIVIGGGDTGTDCVGTSLRHGCKSLVQLRAPAQAARRSARADNPWPQWPQDLPHRLRPGGGRRQVRRRPARVLRHDARSSSATTSGNVDGHPHRRRSSGARTTASAMLKEVPGTEKVWPAQLVLLAMGFLGPENTSARQARRRAATRAPTYKAEHGKFATSVPGVFAAGDCRRGQIAGRLGDQRRPRRRARRRSFLMGSSLLPAPKISLGGATS